MRNLFLLIIAALISLNGQAQGFSEKLALAAFERTHHRIIYDGSYRKIPYPGGDIDPGRGVCTDVVIRSYRALNIDLQQRVHEDMRAHFEEYPARRIWAQSNPDTNIDHRRVPNLQTFFSRHGQSLLISNNPEDYVPGDLVTWMLPGNLPHIGIVSHRKNHDGTPLIVHNIGFGTRLDNSLFAFPQSGHYRYSPASNSTTTHP